MAISVRLNSAIIEPAIHDTATKWTIEKDTEALVLMDAQSQAVAVYGRDKWMTATVVNETHDHDTISRVHGALVKAGLAHESATDAISSMQNAGILFRQRLRATDAAVERSSPIVDERSYRTVVIVVAGVPQQVDINIIESLSSVTRKVLLESGNVGQPPENWELRTEDGRLLSLNLTPVEAGVREGQRLFLSPKAGIGG